MRSLKNVQCTDITAIAFDEYLCIIAIASAYGEIRLIDYQYSTELQMVCQADQNTIVGLAYLKTYPIIVSIDIKGNIWVWKATKKVKWTRFMTKYIFFILDGKLNIQKFNILNHHLLVVIK